MLNLVMLGADATTFCTDSSNIWQFVGWILMVFKIVIPLLLIIFGMVDLGKAVVGSKDEEIKKATGALVKRAIAGIVIFFIPTIVNIIINLVPGHVDWDACRVCVTSPGGDKCSRYVEKMEK